MVLVFDFTFKKIVNMIRTRKGILDKDNGFKTEKEYTISRLTTLRRAASLRLDERQKKSSR